MKEIGMQYEAIDACHDDHIIYYKQHEFETECPECNISRYRTDKVKKRFLTRFFVIFQLFHVCNGSGAKT